MQHQAVLQRQHQDGFKPVAVLMRHRAEQRRFAQRCNTKPSACGQCTVDQIAPASAVRLRTARGAGGEQNGSGLVRGKSRHLGLPAGMNQNCWVLQAGAPGRRFGIGEAIETRIVDCQLVEHIRSVVRRQHNAAAKPTAK